MLQKRFYAGYRLEKDFLFIELVKAIRRNEEIKVKCLPDLFEIVEMEYINTFNSDRKETGKTHIGYDFTYITIEYKNNYYYIQFEEFGSRFTVTGYVKTSATSKQQATYSETFTSYEELLSHMDNQRIYTKPLSKTHNNSIYMLEWSDMKQKAGNREKSIMDNLQDIYYTQHDEHGRILHLVSKDGSSCEYELNRRTFTN